MNLSDADTDVEPWGVHLTTRRGLAWRTIDGQWPRVRSALDAGSPVALAVVTVASSGVRDLGRNHQVLAYRYQARRERVRLWVYDPNRAGDDDVTISFDTCAPTQATAFGHTLGIHDRVRGFFVSPYSPVPPPPPP